MNLPQLRSVSQVKCTALYGKSLIIKLNIHWFLVAFPLNISLLSFCLCSNQTLVISHNSILLKSTMLPCFESDPFKKKILKKTFSVMDIVVWVLHAKF